MPNYSTSTKKPSLKRRNRYVVTYEDVESDKGQRTYAVYEHSASGATARVITYIQENNHPVSSPCYYLTPRISKDKADYTL